MSSSKDHELAMLSALAHVAHSDEQASPDEEESIWTEKAKYKLSPPSSEGGCIRYLHMIMKLVDGAFENRERKVVAYVGAELALRP